MRTPLYLACKEEASLVVALLIQHYANKSAADVDDVTPLMVAKRLQNTDLIMLLTDSTHPMIPSPLSSTGGDYQDIRPKPDRKRAYQPSASDKQYDPLREMPDWASQYNQPRHQRRQQQQQQQQQQQTFNFTNGLTPFDPPSPGVKGVELSPFSDSIPNIMTPPYSWATTSPQSIGGDEES